MLNKTLGEQAAWWTRRLVNEELGGQDACRTRRLVNQPNRSRTDLLGSPAGDLNEPDDLITGRKRLKNYCNYIFWINACSEVLYAGSAGPAASIGRRAVLRSLGGRDLAHSVKRFFCAKERRRTESQWIRRHPLKCILCRRWVSRTIATLLLFPELSRSLQ